MDELEFVLKKIIEIDNKATELKNNTTQIIKEKEATLNQEIKTLDDELIGKSNFELANKHDALIKETEQKAKSITDESIKYMNGLYEKYSQVKDELKALIVKEIIESY